MTTFDASRPGFGFEQPGGHADATEGNDWITPLPLVQRLGSFDLDPCESNNQPWPLAPRGYRLGRGEDGLELPWQGRVYCNPPYGPHVYKWALRMAEHRNGILLIFSRCETAPWVSIWRAGDAFLFLQTRIRFCLPTGQRSGSGTAPSVLIAYGDHNVEALRNSGLAGALVSRLAMLAGVKASSL